PPPSRRARSAPSARGCTARTPRSSACWRPPHLPRRLSIPAATRGESSSGWAPRQQQEPRSGASGAARAVKRRKAGGGARGGAGAARIEGRRADRGLAVTTAAGSGAWELSDEALREAQVLVWAAGAAGPEVPPDRLAGIAARVRDGRLGLVVTGCAPCPEVLA